MKLKYNVEGLDCANCASKIEESINKIDGVENARLSYLTELLKISVNSDVNIDELEKKVDIEGKKIEPDFEISKK